MSVQLFSDLTTASVATVRLHLMHGAYPAGVE